MLFSNFCLEQFVCRTVLFPNNSWGQFFFQEKCFFQICFKQFCLKGRCCFQTSAWGQWFWKRSAVCKPLLGAVCFKGTAVSELLLEAVFFQKKKSKVLFKTVLFEREVLFPDLCLGAVVLKKKCCLQTSAWGSLFQGNCCLRTSAWGSFFSKKKIQSAV